MNRKRRSKTISNIPGENRKNEEKMLFSDNG